MRVSLLFCAVLVSLARGDLFTLDVNGNVCSFPSESLLFPGHDAVCGSSNILHVNPSRLNLSLNTLDANNGVQVAFALSDVSSSSTLATSRTLVYNPNTAFSYSMEWPFKTSFPAWGTPDPTSLWFGSLGGICPLQVDFWRFSAKARWTLDAVTCAIQHQGVTFAFIQANSSHSTPYIGVGTQGTPSPASTQVLPQGLMSSLFSLPLG